MDVRRPIPITFYTKPGCHLCDDVADHLEELAARWPLHLTVVDITSSLELHRLYWDKIPVVVVGLRTLAAPIGYVALAQAVANVGRDTESSAC
ncbi:MAG: glutaredoxin family protein [Chloroflexota bacterium]|nr:glutaredoxin family protein [Chloroflexota bacterium]PLS77367.1 MAG: hypothetical protein CYG59_24260 [Chloroflexota bacterium]